MIMELGDVILCCLISGAIGYFWDIYRAGGCNVTIDKINITNQVNMREFWDRAEAWRQRQEK